MAQQFAEKTEADTTISPILRHYGVESFYKERIQTILYLGSRKEENNQRTHEKKQANNSGKE